jgi:hypothetical protein
LVIIWRYRMKFLTLTKKIMVIILSLGFFASSTLSMEHPDKQNVAPKHSKSLHRLLEFNDIILSSLLYSYTPLLGIPYVDKIPYVGNHINNLVEMLVRRKLLTPLTNFCSKFTKESDLKKLGIQLLPSIIIGQLLEDKLNNNAFKDALKWTMISDICSNSGMFILSYLEKYLNEINESSIEELGSGNRVIRIPSHYVRLAQKEVDHTHNILNNHYKFSLVMKKIKEAPNNGAPF